MPQFSQASLAKLNTCDPRLVKVFTEVIKHFDCQILEGHRDQAAQHEAFVTGHSKLDWPHGNHNAMPSLAVDCAPYPVDFKDTSRILFFAGHVMGIAAMMGIDLRYGGDWNENNVLKDNTFNDLVHFEIHKER